MKKRGEKRREILRPSPNEEANILQSEKEKRKKLRLKQIREQEKAFSRKVLEDARKRKSVELKHLTSHLKSQWENEHNERQSNLERKYQENLAEVGLGHKTASEDQTNYSEPELTEAEKQRASERYKIALEQLMYDRAKSTQSERERAEARQHASETERLRAAKIAALPPPVDPIGDICLRKDQRNAEQRDVESFSTSRFHLHPSVHIERDLDQNQEDARQAAKDEEERIQVIMEEVQRDKAEQTEKARLRHKHALAQLQLEEDHKKLMEELDQLERHDRQRRQDAVAKIPVRIFQPPHKRLEDAEDRQRDLEQAFEDMYMMQTGYTGDLTVALEPPEQLRLASEESDERSVEPERDIEPPQRVPTTVGPDRSSERTEHDSEQEKEPEEVLPHDSAPKAPSEDPLRRLLQRIERQRDQWRRRQPAEEAQPQTAGTTGISRTLPSTEPPPQKQEYRVPDSIPFSASPESLAEAELSEEEAEDGRREVPDMPDRPRLEDGHPLPVPEHEMDAPPPGTRTLLHPLEAAQRSRTTTPSGRALTAQLTQQEALLEQQKLKLRLQQQNLLQQQLEQQLQDYQRQLSDMYGPAEAPGRPSVPGVGALERVSLEEPLPGGPPYDGASSLADSSLEPFQGPGGVQAPQDTALPAEVPSASSQEGSPVMSEGLESSTLGSVTSDETEAGLPSEFRRTLAAARTTAGKAAELRQREKAVLEELSRAAEDVPFSSRTLSERDSSPGRTSSLQSQEPVSISTPSTLSLSVTMSSDLSVTAVMSRTSQTRPAPPFFDPALPLTSQGRSLFSDVADTASITTATSLLTKTSQKFGFSQPPSSSARPFSLLSSGSELDTRILGVLPSAVSSSRITTESSVRNPLSLTSYSGSAQARAFRFPQSSDIQQPSWAYPPVTANSREPLTFTSVSGSAQSRTVGASQSSAIQQSTPGYSSVSSILPGPSGGDPLAFIAVTGPAPSAAVGVPPSSTFQQSSTGYSPGYLDYYHQKIEEERQLFEAQRNRIRRYSDLFKKSSLESPGAQTYQASGSTSKNVPPAEPRMKTTAYLSDLHGSAPTYLERRIGAIGSDTNKENQGYIANSAGIGGQDRLRDISQRLGAFEKSLTTSVSSTLVSSSSYVSKPLSTSAWSNGSSKTEYMSLPRQSAGLGFAGSTGSTLSSLSELTEMMTRLTSTSDESEDKSSRVGAVESQRLTQRTTAGGLGLSVGHSSVTGSEGNLNLRGPARERVYVPGSVGSLDAASSYAPTVTSTKLSSAKEPAVNVPGSRWTRGSDGKQWFVLSRSSTLPSVGGLTGKDNISPVGEGEDSVFPDAQENKSPVSGSEETGSLTSLPSGTLRADAPERLDESFTSSEAHGQAPSTLSSASNGSHGGSSQASDFHGDFSDESEEIIGNEPEQTEILSLQDAFGRRNQEFIINSQARVDKAKAIRSQVKPRVKAKRAVTRSAAETGQKSN